MKAIPAPPTLELYPHWCQPTGPIEPLGNAGGFSGARFWKFDTIRAPLILRRWPADGPGRAMIGQIHAWLEQARDLDFLPVPIATRDSQTLMADRGYLWELAPWRAGSPDLSRPPSPAHLRGMFQGLAAFHRILERAQYPGRSPGMLARSEEIRRLIVGEFDHLNAVIERCPADPCTPFARTWLARARRVAGHVEAETLRASTQVLRLQPCIRDARPDHFLFQQDCLTGLVDFGAMGQDTVATDLARLIGECLGSDRVARAMALDAYEAVRPLDPAEVRVIEPFEHANALLGPARWIRWHFLDRREFDQADAPIRGIRRGLERIDEAGL